MRALRNKPLAVIIAAAIVLLASVSAYSYWTSDGGGSGTAGTGTTSSLTVVQTSTVSAMGPGVAAQPLSGVFNNSSGAIAHVGTVTVEVSGVDAGHAACDADWYAVDGTPMTVDADVAAGNPSGSWSGATIRFVNDPAVSQDACKGATVSLTYAIVD